MKKRQVLTLVCAAVLSVGMMAGCSTGGSTDTATDTATEAATQTPAAETADTEAAEAATEAESAEATADGDILGELAGTYTELFQVIGAEENKSIWIDALSAYTADTDEQELYYDMLVGSCTKEIYGQEAIDTYAENPDDTGFDCHFLDGMVTMTIDGNTISGTDADGNALFSHTYHYVQDQPILYMGEEMGAYHHLYESDDPDSGDFTYFVFADDTPDTTWHLEFRYGANSEDISNYTEGEYAYWNAAAFMQDYDTETLHDVIQLFVDENVGG